VDQSFESYAAPLPSHAALRYLAQARKKAGAAHATPVEVRLHVCPVSTDLPAGSVPRSSLTLRPQVRGRLLHDAKVAGLGDDELLAWVAAPTEQSPGVEERGSRKDVQVCVFQSSRKDICDAWWRTGFCSLKRCSLSHTESISHLRGVPESGGEDLISSPAPHPNKNKGDDAISAGVGHRGKHKVKRGKHAARGQQDPEGAPAPNVGASLPAMDCVPLKSIDAGGQLAYDRVNRTQRVRAVCAPTWLGTCSVSACRATHCANSQLLAAQRELSAVCGATR
jgi:hypothetical protein